MLADFEAILSDCNSLSVSTAAVLRSSVMDVSLPEDFSLLELDTDGRYDAGFLLLEDSEDSEIEFSKCLEAVVERITEVT